LKSRRKILLLLSLLMAFPANEKKRKKYMLIKDFIFLSRWEKKNIAIHMEMWERTRTEVIGRHGADDFDMPERFFLPTDFRVIMQFRSRCILNLPWLCVCMFAQLKRFLLFCQDKKERRTWVICRRRRVAANNRTSAHLMTCLFVKFRRLLVAKRTVSFGCNLKPKWKNLSILDRGAAGRQTPNRVTGHAQQFPVWTHVHVSTYFEKVRVWVSWQEWRLSTWGDVVCSK
jgi:hypothetical protein